ncbi:DNA-directed RNA polymerase II core subunit [Spiromyces aspiralis]|uniref:DNA-directed RNA polymerase II core subunit n=1 Tax=Spiromyces aspiralis TaxID=68401 RepID=A0ACC1HSP6_9FUNG|nr:DNA-directed RNA polymerase II core subunit [Spiromyces aspiralis]
MNAPPRHEMFVLPDGVKKVTITKDTKMPNCMDFEIQKEDHTISNPLRVKLLENPKVLFAGYKAPHPLEYRTIVKIQTTPDTTPIIAMQNAIQELVVEFGSIRSKFEKQFGQSQQPRVRVLAGWRDKEHSMVRLAWMLGGGDTAPAALAWAQEWITWMSI